MTIPLLSDCPDCLVEGGLLEVYEGKRRARGLCRLCGCTGLPGSGAPLSDVEDVLARLARWATEEGTPLEAFCESNFNGLPSFEIALRVVRRERVETGFDVVAFLFPRAALAAAEVQQPAAERVPTAPRPGPLEPTLTVIPWEEPPAVTGRATAAPVASVPVPAPVQDPLDTARALWAVALADGRQDPREDAAITQACVRLGVPVIARTDARLWRPNEVGEVPTPARVLDAMERVARVDGELDRSEIRVLTEYARHWRIPAEGRWAPAGALGSWWASFARG